MSPEPLEQTYRDYAASARHRRKWAADNPGNLAILEELFTSIRALARPELAGAGPILDVGCGGGRLLAELADKGGDAGRLHGVDMLGSRVTAARQRVPGADVRVADARALPYDDGVFDLVALLTCLSSMPDLGAVRRALAEVRRVLRPGGVVLVYEPRIGNPFNRATIRIPRRVLTGDLGAARESRRVTGFPPVARRLGRTAPALYPVLARIAPTHRVSVFSPD